MKRKIGIKELHSMARQMKYYDFENWVAKELFDQPETVDTSKLTDKLFLYDVMSSKILIEKNDLLELITKALKEGYSTYEVVEAGLESFDAKQLANYIISKYV